MPQSIELAAYRTEIRMLLKASPLTPGAYRPSDDVRSGTHAAVLVGGRPVVLCGSYDDPLSLAHARGLASSGFAAAAFYAAGFSGPVDIGSVDGRSIAWADAMTAIVGKPAGQAEDGSGTGPLIAIVLHDPSKALATALCVTTETARVLDPSAPDLDDGRTLGDLARVATSCRQSLLIHLAHRRPC
ncbi:hypothetical protein [Azospirillum canadense]|uniref:hypothetical protein n=1 Tax=Azospirillum canadense TaxID=403962 RepID=UPI002227C43C|nr:hypothetical protein [Azospirillum canadense]MCW2240652.1 hypothetical protein [Azospirillum canadense]